MCQDCGSMYAANRWESGETKPIGRNRCKCGSTEFTVITTLEGTGSDRGD